jgi:Family of unknown function (DUF5709)
MPDDEIYDPSDNLEDDGTLDASDTLDGDPGDDPLDTGIAPPDRWSAGEGFGTTLAEEREGESLDQLLAEEEPDLDPYAEEELAEDATIGGDQAAREGPGEAAEDLLDDGPEARAGRLVAEDEGAHPDEEPDLVAHDVGMDGGAAGAEEAAVHVVADNSEMDASTGN